MSTVAADCFRGMITQALERMAFVLAEPVADEPLEVLADGVAHAAIDLRGPVGFRLALSASAGLIRGVASGMLGLDAMEIDLREHAQATVAELANVFAGELIMLLTAGNEQASLGLPEDVDAAAVRALVDDPAEGFVFVVGGDDGRLLVVARRR